VRVGIQDFDEGGGADADLTEAIKLRMVLGIVAIRRLRLDDRPKPGLLSETEELCTLTPFPQDFKKALGGQVASIARSMCCSGRMCRIFLSVSPTPTPVIDRRQGLTGESRHRERR
jgi:hypothetical protein